ncbi:hypothetical protein [Streptomyces coeruleorubidus]
MEQIVEAAGLTRITVHRRFANRQALLEAPVAGWRSVVGSSGRVGVDSLAMPAPVMGEAVEQSRSLCPSASRKDLVVRRSGERVCLSRSRAAAPLRPRLKRRRAARGMQWCPASSGSVRSPPGRGGKPHPVRVGRRHRGTPGPVLPGAGSQDSSVRWR